MATGRMGIVYMILFTFVERYVLLNREPSLKDAALAEARRALKATVGRSDLWNLIMRKEKVEAITYRFFKLILLLGIYPAN